jgi:hypothetical protein
MKIEKCLECQNELDYIDDEENSFIDAGCYHNDGSKIGYFHCYFYYREKDITNYLITESDKRFHIELTKNLAIFKLGYGVSKEVFSFEINNMNHEEIMNKFNQLITFM